MCKRLIRFDSKRKRPGRKGEGERLQTGQREKQSAKGDTETEAKSSKGERSETTRKFENRREKRRGKWLGPPGR